MTATSTKTAPTPNVTESAPVETTPTVTKQLYFVPEYNVSVEATSLEEAISLAKSTKGKN